MIHQKTSAKTNLEHTQSLLPADATSQFGQPLPNPLPNRLAVRNPCKISILITLWVCTMTGCAASAKIRSDPNFSSAALSNRTVLVLPIAVSDEFEDKRTGMALNQRVRYDAASAACQYASKLRPDVKLICFDSLPVGAKESAEHDVMLQFALDATIGVNAWQALGRQSGASHVLLFRPESTNAAQSTSAGAIVQPSDALTLGLGVWLVASAVGGSDPSQRTTRQSYFLSSALVDLQNGRVLRVGAHSREGSKSVPAARNLGYVEGPEAGPILQEVIQDLEVALLK